MVEIFAGNSHFTYLLRTEVQVIRGQKIQINVDNSCYWGIADTSYVPGKAFSLFYSYLTTEKFCGFSSTHVFPKTCS